VAGDDEALDPLVTATQLTMRTDTLPASDAQRHFDASLARGAAGVATRRHAGTIEEGYGPEGRFFVQRGKDLGGVDLVIGTGGIFGASSDATARWILEATAKSAQDPDSLLPEAPALMVDRDYVLYAVGLLADVAPEAAYALAAGSLVTVSADVRL
jgi:uncharacterized protein (TIGR01319 family)